MRLAEIQWGDDSAEKDPFLLEYFVTSDAFRRVRERTKNIVVGRKGSGKSALRKKLEQEFRNDPDTFVVNLSPKYNAIRNVLNDKDIVQTFGQEIFFQHTWLRQILLDCLCVIGDHAKGKFAQESHEFARRISVELNRTSKDFVENIADILSKVKGKAGSLGDFGVQVERELRSIAEVDALEYHVLRVAEGGARFVILIDDLDLGWDNSHTANNMLLGLLAATSYLSGKTHNIFPCIFLREDVYSILVTRTQHSDKYRNVERIRWERADLLNILDQRIIFNRKRYRLGHNPFPFWTVFPAAVGSSNTDNWLIERTLERPRELIQLARYYTESVDTETPDGNVLKESESSYSAWKLDDLCAEYSNQYPGLVTLFAYWKTKFFRRKYHLKRAEAEEMLLQIASEVEINQPWWNQIVEHTDIDVFLKVLYEIGFLGDFVVGGEGGSKTFYSFVERHEPRFEEVQIHPCFRRSVNTVERIRSSPNKSTSSVEAQDC
jgi:hypothetical protein